MGGWWLSDGINMEQYTGKAIALQSQEQEHPYLDLFWIVERAFSWINHSRRLDFEIKTCHEANMFMISHLHTLLRHY